MKTLRYARRLIGWLLLVVMLNATARAEEKPGFEIPAGNPLIDQAMKAFDQKQYARSARLLVAAINESRNERWSLYYIATCAFVGAGKHDAAFRYLDGAFRRGFWYVEYLETDDKLAPLHADRRWSQALVHCRAARAKINFAVRQELLDLGKEDQQVRARVTGPEPPPDVIAEMNRVDLKTRTRLSEIIKQTGWPLISTVGFDGANAVWLIAQHADRDLTFQKQALNLMRAAARRGEAAKEHLAFLIDRVRVAEGKKQIYGTQNEYKDGRLVMRPVVDEKNLDRRRKRMGLPPIDFSLKWVQQQTARPGQS
jgi:hypothetical protein